MASTGKKITGLIAATYTPMSASSDVNLPVIQQYVDYLVHKQHIKNIFVNGTTGEWMSLNVTERKRLAEAWVKHAKGKMDNVIVHVGCLSLEDAKDLAAHAASCGADAISAVSPFFIKPSNEDALVLYLKEVAAAAPNLPFYYYHIPVLTNLKFQANVLVGKMQQHIPSFQGVKFTDVNLMDFGLCISQYDQVNFLYGVDEQLLGALIFGAHGAVGSTYNFLGAINNKMLKAFEEGNLQEARKIESKIQAIIAFIFAAGGGLPEFKAIMSMVSGIDLGPPRLPLLSSWKPEHTEKTRAEMKKLELI